MNRVLDHTLAAVAAFVLTLASIGAIVTVPTSQAAVSGTALPAELA